MDEHNRSKERVLSIRLLPEEAKILKAKAEKAHMSQATFLKNVIVSGGAYEKANFTKKDIDILHYEIDRIGNNLNQIAYLAHNSEMLDKSKFFQLYENYLAILSAFYDFILDTENN